jgi:hypothetical protein
MSFSTPCMLQVVSGHFYCDDAGRMLDLSKILFLNYMHRLARHNPMRQWLWCPLLIGAHKISFHIFHLPRPCPAKMGLKLGAIQFSYIKHCMKSEYSKQSHPLSISDDWHSISVFLSVLVCHKTLVPVY